MVADLLQDLSKWPKILVVVVLPCVPAIATQKLEFAITPRTSALFNTLKLLETKCSNSLEELGTAGVYITSVLL